jgi:hypothetical protein
VEINFLLVLSGDITLSISTSEFLKTSLLDLLIILLGLVGVLKALVNLLPVLVGLKNFNEVQMSSASDDESDALIIDEPVVMDTDLSDNEKNPKYPLIQNISQDGLHHKSEYSFRNDETPRSPPLEGVAMDTSFCRIIMATPDRIF